LLGFKSRWTTPAEWTYFNPRCGQLVKERIAEDPNEKDPQAFIDTKATHENLIEEVLDELFLKRARGKQSVEVSSQKLGNKVTKVISLRVGVQAYHIRHTYPQEER
jgi:hypothetical protein